MSAYTHRILRCDENGCDGIFGTTAGDGIHWVRRAARLEGWTHPSGYVDHCPEHSP